MIELIETTGWGPAQLSRLHDVEWAARAALPTPERLLGVTPRFSITAG